ncbi:MAG: hypothetical protein Q8O10_02095 [candidate division Zixibacteria bacterium]|nr:hypothetical protein [candidate division Zixibacteria bacterium]
MVAETVKVQKGEEEWEVNCIFILRNSGESSEVQIGFPDLTERSPGQETIQGTINNFKCFVDGKEIQTEHKQGVRSPLDPELTYPFAYVWRTAFGKHQTHRIVNTYSFKGMFSSDGLIWLRYVLKTGALWKGKIKKAILEFDLGEIDPRFVTSIRPSGFVIRKNKIRWTFSDFEPKEDIEITYYLRVQNWAKMVDKFLNSDSAAILVALLNEALFHPESQIAPELMKYFNKKIEMMIKKVQPFQDVELYKLLLAKNRGDKKDTKKRCEGYLRKFSHKEEFSLEEESVLSQCTWISGDFLKDYSLAQSFLKIQLRLVDYKINNPEKLPYMSSELDRKRFVEEKQQILRTIEVYEQKKQKK